MLDLMGISADDDRPRQIVAGADLSRQEETTMTVHDHSGTTLATDHHVAPEHISDEAVADQVRTHHSAMVAELDRLSAAVRDAAPGDYDTARDELARWFETVLVPHADEEEATTYHAGDELPEGHLLIQAMVREHVLIKRLVALFRESEPAAAAAAYGRAAFEAFDSHQRKENELILPLLVAAPGVSLAKVMGHAHGHHQVGEHAEHGHEHAHHH